MFRREMCTGKIGVEARRNGLAARREEQRNRLLQNRRNVTSDSNEKKVPVPKPKESAAERRARLDQYREMKIRKESELRTERLKTPAFKVGAAPLKERTTPSTARKVLNFDFKKISEREGPPVSGTPGSRKGVKLGNPLGGATTSKKDVGTALNVQSGPRTAVKRNLQTGFAPEEGASRSLQTPRIASKATSSSQKMETPPASTNRGQTTPKTETRAPTPSRTISNRFTPSKAGPSSALKKPAATSSSSSRVVDASKPMQTPRMPASSRQLSTKKTTPNGTGTKVTPAKSSTTPLKSIGPKPPREKTTPKRTPLASRTRLNLSKQKAEKSDATVEEKKASFTPNKQVTTSLRRAQSSNNLSRPTPSQSSKKPDAVPRVKNPPPATTLKRAQSTNDLSRPSPLRSAAKLGPLASRNKTPQMQLQRSTSATTLTRKALTSSSPGSKPRLNLAKKFAGDSKSKDDTPRLEVPQKQKQKLNTRSHSTLTSGPKTGAVSRIQAAVLKNQAKAEAQKQNPVCENEENNKKWADLVALMQAQKDL